MPPTESPPDLPNRFGDFFLNKIHKKIEEWFQEQDINKSYHRKCTKFTSFGPLEENEILRVMKNMNPTTCIMDPCNTRFLLKFKNTILDSINTIVNQSFTTGTFLEDWKLASVRQFIKGQNLNTELTNYKPISNYCTKHFDNQSLLTKHQSTYRQNFSKETTL